MNIKDLSLADLLSAPSSAARLEKVEVPVAPQGIAIIGMAAQIGCCEDLASFWRLLANGQTATRRLPTARVADLQEYLRLKGYEGELSRDQCLRLSYLSEVDKFDHAFFGLSRQEANLTDPNQRLFLQTAWAALEHAGYGGASVQGSSTGLYVGFSSDFGEDYRRVIHTCAPDAPEISVSGNVKSIIASRLAYHLDLHGPSLLVDTACSSGLTAVHLACQALRQGDCTMALAGAVKIDLVPVIDNDATGIGTKDIADTIAGDGRTKTFDERCDGTSGAEGVLAFVLKPLVSAQQDGDHIHAVIRSSALNQDGLSVGITAPNSAAQEALILRALAAAGVPAESISYIEAHGTATRLGDPIEISGIQRAFRQQTDRHQFCAVGSVKTNLGHMDNAAGLAGLAKVVLALQHHELPASLNFTIPNRQIPFARSPVYVNDVHRQWDVPAGHPRRAGINSFGLSGTNAHVIVEEHLAMDTRPIPQGSFLLPLSARTAEALQTLVRRYANLLRAIAPEAWRPNDLCYTAATGRRHHEHRVAFCFSTLDRLRHSLDEFLQERRSPEKPSWWQGRFRLVSEMRSSRPGELTESAQDALSLQSETLRTTTPKGDRASQLSTLGQLYVAGAAVAWDAWFAGQACRRIPLPTYPFARERCWVETTPRGEIVARRSTQTETPLNPLLSRLIADTEGLRLFATRLSADTHWELADHKVKGTCILPGTCYIEMMLAANAFLHDGHFTRLRFEEIQFLRPLATEENESREVHLQVRETPEGQSLRIISRSTTAAEPWQIHAEARWSAAAPNAPGAADPDFLRELKARLTEPVSFARYDDTSRGLEIGDRWNESFVAGWQNAARTECLVQLRLPPAYANEERTYHFHPALLDAAVNAMNHLLDAGSLYLPFSYQSLEVYRPLPPEFTAHLRRQPNGNDELISIDLELHDSAGQLCAKASGYRVKRVSASERIGGSEKRDPLFHALEWHSDTEDAVAPAAVTSETPVLLVRSDRPGQAKLAEELRTRGYTIVESVIHTGTNPTQLLATLGQLPPLSWSGLLYTAGLPDEPNQDSPAELPPLEHEQCIDTLTYFSAFVQGVLQHRFRLSGPLLVATRFGQTTANPTSENLLPTYAPGQAALGAFAQIAGLENQQLNIRVVDTDEADVSMRLAHELGQIESRDLAVYRQGRRQLARIRSLDFPSNGNPLKLDGHGVYIITGGTGALGLELAHELATRGQRLCLALLGQSVEVDRTQWPRLAAHNDRRIALRYQRLNALAEIAELECYAVDVADAPSMTALLKDLRLRRGRILGVVHAAGRAGEGFLFNKQAEQMHRVLRPKVAGAWLLHQLTHADELQFFVLYSSIATVLHNPGQSDYTAGNAFLNALAHYRRSRDLPALSICWPAWREVGIAVTYGAVDEQEFFSPIATRLALDSLNLALALQRELPPVVVLGEINTRLTREEVEKLGLSLSAPILRRLKHATNSKAQTGRSTSRATEVVLRGLDEPDDFDRLVGQVWSETLAMPEIEVDTPFSDLGGNSILITQMFRAYESRQRGVMEMADLFSLTTIREQAAHFRKALQKKSPPRPASRSVPAADVDAILDQLARGELSIEEAERFV